jgi:hypothetical protein
MSEGRASSTAGLQECARLLARPATIAITNASAFKSCPHRAINECQKKIDQTIKA